MDFSEEAQIKALFVRILFPENYNNKRLPMVTMSWFRFNEDNLPFGSSGQIFVSRLSLALESEKTGF
uniref:Uncharacterized protein n=1 Tax=Candidatus Kentrum sp. FW TaxID=2126338 RepID=A0A450SR16_9GAMM|nr:MAG: hypothetical protein BECKFW1821A_GA0114235_106116 [Candidatus Kentron sp. FW]